MRAFLLILLVSLVVSAQVRPYNFSPVPRVELLYGVSHVDGYIEIQVESNGCTEPDSFHVMKDYNSEDQVVRLLFVRYKPDWCKAYIADGVRLRFSKEDLGLQRNDILRVENPIGPNRRPED